MELERTDEVLVALRMTCICNSRSEICGEASNGLSVGVGGVANESLCSPSFRPMYHILAVSSGQIRYIYEQLIEIHKACLTYAMANDIVMITRYR